MCVWAGNCGGPFVVGGEYTSENSDCEVQARCGLLVQHVAVFPRELSHAEVLHHVRAAGILHPHPPLSPC